MDSNRYIFKYSHGAAHHVIIWADGVTVAVPFRRSLLFALWEGKEETASFNRLKNVWHGCWQGADAKKWQVREFGGH